MTVGLSLTLPGRLTHLLIWTDTSVTRFAASIIPEAESTRPPVGLATSPTTPFPTPKISKVMIQIIP